MEYEKVLEKALSYNVVTNDKEGFPFTVKFSIIFHREGYKSLFFLVSNDSLILENITHSSKASVTASIGTNEANIRTINLKGIFTIENTENYSELQNEIDIVRKAIRNDNVKLIKFTTLKTRMDDIVNLGLYYN
ncbi:hypothetical protein [Enterococcus sp. AZ126]|uniref:hypothetical protein n=1 Tax=Enterococcus sp. AZ126 TaxID=2774635 RepID=UPI003F211258